MHSTGTTRWLLGLLVVCAALGGWLLTRDDGGGEAGQSMVIEQQSEAPGLDELPPVAAPAPEGANAEAAAPRDPELDELLEPLEGPDERLAALRENPELLERARQLHHAELADRRWSSGVEEGGYTSEDVDPSVRAVFTSMELEPVVLTNGLIGGLVIRWMPDDHPFEAAGFAVGDRLSSIQGTELSDPSVLPALFARLGPHFEVCSETATGSEHCEEIALD